MRGWPHELHDSACGRGAVTVGGMSDAEVPNTNATPRGAKLSTATLLLWHLGTTLIHALMFANVMWLMPMLVRLRFGSDNPDIRDWQTTVVTAAVPTFLVFSIFWGELLRRVRLRRYLLIFWLMTVFPFGCVGFVQNYWQLLACHILGTIGLAGWAPLNGHVLKRFYGDAVRGRMYAILAAASHLSGIVSVYFLGRWVEENPAAFRVFMPTAAVLELGGLMLLAWLDGHVPKPRTRKRARRRSLLRLVYPILSMGKVLRADPTFLRYELAFMTYGAAFMFCEVLLPVFATTRFDMRYEEYSHSTQVFTKLAMLLMVFPMGWFLDRTGPIRTCVIAFSTLALYPVLLLIAQDATGVAIASTTFGVGLSGVMMGWMLGPVALAPSVEKTAQYSAIHATMVGIRGIVFQGLGMLIYKLTGSFVWPLLAAALGFAWAAWQMWQLQAAVKKRIAARDA